VDSATEAWVINFVDGTQPESVNGAAIELTIGQWATTNESAAFYRAHTKDIEDIVAAGEVTIAATGEVSGAYLLTHKALNEPEEAALSNSSSDDVKDDRQQPDTQTASAAEATAETAAETTQSAPVQLSEKIGVMWWRNGTVVIKAVGPIELLSDFYSAFPL